MIPRRCARSETPRCRAHVSRNLTGNAGPEARKSALAYNGETRDGPGTMLCTRKGAARVSAAANTSNAPAGGAQEHLDRLAIVVVTYKRQELLSRLFDSFATLTQAPWRIIVIDNEDGDYDEDAVMMDALDAGADDFNAEDNVFEITTDPDAFNDVVKALEEKNYAFVSADISLVPQTYVKLESDEDIKNMEKLLDMLDDNEDVQNTYHNWDQD